LELLPHPVLLDQQLTTL